jgi:hypothetical protein
VRVTENPSIHEVTIEETGLSDDLAPTSPNINTASAKWWIITGSTGVQGIPMRLVEMAGHNRLEAKYGIAAPFGSPRNSLFMGLPLQDSAELGLPVSVNAVSSSLLISSGHMLEY